MEVINAAVQGPTSPLTIEITTCEGKECVTGVTLDVAMNDVQTNYTESELESLKQSARELAHLLDVPMSVTEWVYLPVQAA